MKLFPGIKLFITITLTAVVLFNCNSVTEPDDSAAGNLFVLNGLGEQVSLINLETEQVTNGFVDARDVPADIAIHGKNLLVLNSTPASLDVYNLVDRSAVKSLNLTAGSNPYAMLISGEHIFISGLKSNRVYVIDASGNYDITDSVDVGIAPEGMAMDSDYLYVACTGGWFNSYDSSTVHVIDPETLLPVDTVETGTNPQRMAWSSDGRLHVVCTGNYADISGAVSVIDPADMTVETTIQTGGAPGHITITSDDIAYLSDFGVASETDSTGYLYSYDALSYSVLNNNAEPVLVGYGAGGLEYDAEGDRLFIANFGIDAVQQFNPDDNSVTATYEVGDGPQNLVYRVPVSN
jgi:YVTN family beta-propeller protein